MYIHVARACYKNVYLFERNISPLTIQKNNRELESIIQDCIMKTIRESIPTEEIIKAYMDESVEQEEEIIIEDVKEEEKQENDNTDDTKTSDDKEGDKEGEKMENLPEETPPPQVPTIQNADDETVVTKLTFNDFDSVLDSDTGKVIDVNAPKTIERLEEISSERAIQRQLEEEDDIEDRIKIHTDNIDLGEMDIMDISEKKKSSNNEPVSLTDVVEILE